MLNPISLKPVDQGSQFFQNMQITGKLLWTKCSISPVITQTFGKRVIAKLIPVDLIPLMTLILVQFRLQLNIIILFVQVHSDFVAAATRGAVAVIDGNVMAINPGEEAK